MPRHLQISPTPKSSEAWIPKQTPSRSNYEKSNSTTDNYELLEDYLEKENEKYKALELNRHNFGLQYGKWVFSSKPPYEKRTIGLSKADMDVFANRRADMAATITVFASITGVMFLFISLCLIFNGKSTWRNCKFTICKTVDECRCCCCKKPQDKPKRKQKPLVAMEIHLQQMVLQRLEEAKQAQV